MDNKNINNLFKSKLGVFLIFYLSILIGFYFDENALGGAKHDFFHHYQFSQKFNVNFLEMFQRFGDKDMGTRNSPIFWIIIAFLNKIIPIEIIRILNSLVSLLIGFCLYNCLKIKFKNQNKITLILLTSTVFLSPTIRSLSIWPYNQIWGLLLFILSIYYFLKFKETRNKVIKFKLSLKFLFFLIMSSYIHPSFAIFILYYIFHLYDAYKFSKHSFYLILFCLSLSIPFLIYLFSTNVVHAFYSAEGIDISISQSLNLSNKIIIISSMFLFFILPVININKTIEEIKLINFKILLIILFLGLVNIYYFNFPYFETGGFGGGFFHKLSNKLFENNFLLYFMFIISLITMFGIFANKIDNYILFIVLILSNPQFTIYHKYFDPLIFILFLTLFKFDIKKHFFEKKYKFFQLYSLSFLFLIMSLLKSYVL
jgi:hypothetical protein